MKIEIRKTDLSKITMKEAWLRYSVLLVLTVFQQIGYIEANGFITDADLASMSYMQYASRLGELTPQVHLHWFYVDGRLGLGRGHFHLFQ